MKLKDQKREYAITIARRCPYPPESKLIQVIYKDLQKLNLSTLVELAQITRDRRS